MHRSLVEGLCLHLQTAVSVAGTGKTSFARLMFDFMYGYGVLQKRNFVERNALELKGSSVGSTTPKVQEAVRQAMGGCLFLDEAYALVDTGAAATGHTDPFSQDAIRTLLTEVENNRGNLMVVLAGYKDKIQRLMRADPGLPSRFPKSLHLSDYSAAELAQVCTLVAKKRFNLVLADGLEDRLAKHIADYYPFQIPEQNARLAVNLVEAAVEKQMDRLGAAWATEAQLRAQCTNPSRLLSSSLPPSRLTTTRLEEYCRILTDADFGISVGPTRGDLEERRKIEAEVQGMIGMPSAKAFFEETRQLVQFLEAGGNPQILRTSLNMVITGNPGAAMVVPPALQSR